jgi:hypothetical protein
MNEELVLNSSDFAHFRQWLRLNEDSLTWQGRYKAEFEEFWSLFFVDGISCAELVKKFDFAQGVTKIGPLVSWLEWLREKFLLFLFVQKNLSIREIAEQTSISPCSVGHTLRSYFVECFPRFDDELSDLFQVSHIASLNIDIKLSDVRNRLSITREILGSHDDEIMPSMEVTLYEEWGILLFRLRKDQFKPSIELAKLKKQFSLQNYLNFTKEIVILLIIALVATAGVKHFNKFYERFLVEKISIYEPQFQWLDRSLIFKGQEDALVAQFNLEVEDLDDVVDVASTMLFLDEEERFDPESEVVLTSWDALPRDFNVAQLEVSSFEELSSGGYRDTRFGRTKVFRVMMKSVDLLRARDNLNQLLAHYSVTQADNVRPGQLVPGGLYYNLFVPLENLKEFLAQVMEVDDAVLYESRTRAGSNPPGQNKVFIWVKSI